MKSALQLAVFSALAVSPTLVHAQAGDNGYVAPSQNVSVLQRPHPEYDPVGIRAGGFLLLPRIEASVTHDDNIFAQNTGQVSDTYFVVSPRAVLASDWGRNMLTAQGYVADYRFSERETESHTDYGASANGRLDLDRGSNITASVAYDRLSEPRSSIDALSFVREPIRYDIGKFGLGAQKEFNRVRISGTYDRTQFDYDDGVSRAGLPVSQAYRNRSQDALSGRVDYAMSPDTSFFVTGTRNTITYDQQGGGLPDRDSEGYNVDVGTAFDVTALMRGRVQVGYLSQSFNDPRYSASKGVSASANIDYFPTQITTVTFRASRSFQSTGVADAAGYAATSVGGEVDHELFRNVILIGRLSYDRNEFTGIDREDDRYNASFSANYLMN
ncbi:MAG: hypothetical protein BGO02_11280, partial [Brevundimonas sp. 67-6]